MRWLPFLLLMIPYGWTLVQLAQRRRATASANLALAAGSILFTGLWFLLGKIDEVRIFIPFALTLTPLTVQFLMRRLERASLLEQATASDLL
jgi:hypothetical protein